MATGDSNLWPAGLEAWFKLPGLRWLLSKIHQLEFSLNDDQIHTERRKLSAPSLCADHSAGHGKNGPMNIQHYQAGETIIAEGTHGSQTFLITGGQVLICKETGVKGRIPLATLSEGEVFGEMYLFDETGFRSATVIAQSAVTLEVISKEEMQQYLKETPPIVLSLMKTLSNRLAQTSQENSLLKFQESAGFFGKLFMLLKG